VTDEDGEPYVPRDKLGRPIGRARHFDPLSEGEGEGEVPVSPEVRRRIEKRAAVAQEIDQIARHLQLPGGRMPEDERGERLSRHEREAVWRKLRDFPPIPEPYLHELERLIGMYGMPLMELSSDTAAFVVRRVVSDYHRVRVLRRDYTAKALFTPDELLALLRTLRLRPWQLAEIVDPDRQHTVNAAVHRWLAGLHAPTGKVGSGYAFTVNRLIEQHVRRPSKGRPVPSGSSGSAKRRRKERALVEGLFIPLASSARQRKEEGDAQRGEE
jgi:hypothetical protein